MRYESIPELDAAAVSAAIERDDPDELLYVPVSVSLYAEDLAWAEAICVRLAHHDHFNVRGNAILGFAHLARRFKTLDRARVAPLVRAALNDPDAYVRGHAHDALDDIRHFLGWDPRA